jgi:hypothetical protein
MDWSGRWEVNVLLCIIEINVFIHLKATISGVQLEDRWVVSCSRSAVPYTSYPGLLERWYGSRYWSTNVKTP